MSNLEILRRLYKDYTKKYLNKIFLAVFFSILVAGSTSATAWLLDPAIDKIFINKDQSLLLIIPLLIILAILSNAIISNPIKGFIILVCVYLVSIPFASIFYLRLKKKAEALNLKT